MNQKILNKLAEVDNAGNALPKWTDVNSLSRAAKELQDSLQGYLRGKLLLGIKSGLKDRNVDSWFVSDSEKARLNLINPTDVGFNEFVDLCIKGNDAVLVSAGSGDDPDHGIVWLGYIRAQGATEQQQSHYALKIGELFRERTVHTGDPSWYAYYHDKVINYDNCLNEGTFGKIADTLIKMRDDLG